MHGHGGSACLRRRSPAEGKEALPKYVNGICGPSCLSSEIIDGVPGEQGWGRPSLLTVYLELLDTVGWNHSGKDS